ncbi:MAG TPA: hypothetical protein VG328_06860 [Stellaceae bacterium]|jgi:hypothetical protein|nr:hypothetical protein [Stellaceae bacterium]
MKRDQDEKEKLHANLQRWRDMLRSDTVEDDGRRALRELIADAEKRLADIEGHAPAH